MTRAFPTHRRPVQGGLATGIEAEDDVVGDAGRDCPASRRGVDCAVVGEPGIGETRPVERPTLRDVIARGDGATAQAWATSPASIDELRAELVGGRRTDVPDGVSGRDAVDNLGVAVQTCARSHPDLFLAAFDDPRSRDSTFVLSGLGAIDHQVAAARLIGALSNSDCSVRVAAAIGLGRQSDPSAAPALVAALDDTEYLVRYHALRGLAVHADPRTEAGLVAFLARDPLAGVDRTLATDALLAVRASR